MRIQVAPFRGLNRVRTFSTVPSVSNKPQSLGFGINYHPPNQSDQVNKKVVVIAGWVGSNERQLRAYTNFYRERGFDVLSFSVTPAHVLQPEKSMQQMKAVLDHLDSNTFHKITQNNQDNFASIDQIVFHHFSVGGFLYGQLLRLIEDSSHHKQTMTPLIKAQIFDSPPDFNGIAGGIARSMTQNPILEKTLQFGVQSYLNLTKDTSGVEHRASSQIFHQNPILHAPSLWFYSKQDVVANYLDCQKVIQTWTQRGIEVEECMWDHTPHIQHARVDPDRYFGILEKFLQRNNILSN